MVETKSQNSTKGCKVRSPSCSHPDPVPPPAAVSVAYT